MARRALRGKVTMMAADATPTPTGRTVTVTDAPPPAPKKQRKLTTKKIVVTRAAAAAAAEITPTADGGTPLSQVYRSTKRARPGRASAAAAFVTPVGPVKKAASSSSGGAVLCSPLGHKTTRMGDGPSAAVDKAEEDDDGDNDDDDEDDSDTVAASPGAYLGRRVSCYWKTERKWFDGTLVKWTEGKGYRCLYDDGDVEDGVDFPDESIRVLPVT